MRSSHIELHHTRHREASVILLIFDGREDWVEVITALPQVRYSKTYQRYYIPNDRESIAELISTGLPIQSQIPITGHAASQLADQRPSSIEASMPRHSSLLASSSSQEAGDIGLSSRSGVVEVCYSSRQFIIKFPYHEELVTRVKSLHRAWWHRKTSSWIVYGSYENHAAIQAWLHCWTDTDYDRIAEMIDTYDQPTTVTIYQVANEIDKVYIEVRGRRKILGPIMTIQSYETTVRPHVYRAQYHPDTVLKLKADYKTLGITVIDRTADTRGKPKQHTSLGAWLDGLAHRAIGRQKLIVRAMGKAMIRSRMSRNSIRSYLGPVLKFDTWLQSQQISTVDQSVVNEYLSIQAGTNLSDAAIHRIVSGLKYYFKHVSSNKDIVVDKITRPSKRISLPRIISTGSVMKMIKVTSNSKHRNIIVTLYSSGLRLSELINLRLSDILWDRHQIIVRGGKGKKDRSVMLSTWLTQLLEGYFHDYKPTTYLFESTRAGTPYSASSIQSIVRQASRKANISQRVTPHVLRHCFATHLHDDGIDIGLIQRLLGHKHINTTLIYTHVSTARAIAIESPIDGLMNQKVGNGDKI